MDLNIMFVLLRISIYYFILECMLKLFIKVNTRGCDNMVNWGFKQMPLVLNREKSPCPIVYNIMWLSWLSPKVEY